MRYRDDLFSVDDKCYLFLTFPFDWSFFSKLPMELAPGIYLTLTPQRALARAAERGASLERNVGLAAWVYPGYGLGMGICNVCIKIDAKIPSDLRDRYFWLMIEAIYLVKPLYINIAGSFSYGNLEDGFLAKAASRIAHRSNIWLDSSFSHSNMQDLLLYNENDFKQAGIYFSQFIRIFNSRKTFTRPYFNLKAFFEATLWECSIYASTSFSKLFPIIDSFVGNPSHDHDKKVSKRLGLFLKEVSSPLLNVPISEEEIRIRLLSIWHLHRPPDLHGYLKEPDLQIVNSEARRSIDKSELKDLFDLMEFTRIAIIKMLHLDEVSFQEYCQIPIPRQKYKEKIERVNAEKMREAASKQFFEKKTYPNPKSMIAYSDFVGHSEPELTEDSSSEELVGI